MGTPNTVGICANCGEPVIQYNNTGAYQHYPAHPLTKPATDCLAPHVLAKDKVTVGLASTLKQANPK